MLVTMSCISLQNPIDSWRTSASLWRRFRRSVTCALGLASLPCVLSAAVDFSRDIQPLLEAHCMECHDADTAKGGFRIDRRAVLLQGGDSGEPTVVPGDPERSFLLKVIRHEVPKLEMPRKAPQLPETSIRLLETWIREGAGTPESWGPDQERPALTHWAFLPPKRSSQHDHVDAFIEAGLREAGLTPSPEADRRVLLRRLYLVMLGLPPTPSETREFLQDTRPDTWERWVEKALASPHYGERWATYWLDLVRFGETHGFETNRERPNAWRYRDWVIRSLNEDKPYDQFIREQVAGDALDAPVGTGFLVAGPYDQVKGQDPKLRLMQRMNELDDIINTTGTAFLALTTGCARCHNHKFDPMTQKDYYALQAVFAGIEHADRPLPPPPERKRELAELEKEVTGLNQKLKAYLPKALHARIVLDETEAEPLQVPKGRARMTNASDSPFGDESYTWWQNTPGQALAQWTPRSSGRHRIWISWGAGYPTHSADARYVLTGPAGTREVAQVNQKLKADGNGPSRNTPLWSGYRDAGLHLLQPGDLLQLVGGKEGTAITADSVVFEPVQDESIPALTPERRSPVNARRNEETFPARLTRYVRFTILETSSGEPCMDELEIYAGERNVALASSGAKATSSGDFKHPLHKLEHIHDGKHGNPHSWISAQKTGGWVQIELAEAVPIDRVVWGRDREEKYSDRLAIQYRIEGALEWGEWEYLAGSGDRLAPGGKPTSTTRYVLQGLPEAEREQAEDWISRLKKVEERMSELSKPVLVYAGKFQQPGPTYRLYRGEPDAQREQVGPDALEAFTSLHLTEDTPEQERRLALANWLASRDNPLTARVMANRIWQFHFGTGIVDTPSDFGRNGTPPSHPELLDWLALELMEHGWSLKHLHRKILLSRTWKQAGEPDAKALRVDGATRLLWRFPPRRLEAEAIRDSILAVTGVLNRTDAGGPGFDPFKVELENVRHYHPKEKYGPEDWRRMVYMTRVRQERESVFGAFDCPDASQAVPKRSRSTTPLQALNLLNSSFMMQQAGLFAERLAREASSTEQRLDLAWQLCFNRPPSKEEQELARSFVDQEGWVQFSRALLNANEMVFIP